MQDKDECVDDHSVNNCVQATREKRKKKQNVKSSKETAESIKHYTSNILPYFGCCMPGPCQSIYPVHSSFLLHLAS